MLFHEFLQDKSVTLLGLGRSSVAAARLLKVRGAHPFVSDAGQGAALEPYASQLEALGISYELGGHGKAALREAQMLVLSPGVPAGLPILEAPRDAGTPIIGELELASRLYTGTIFAITGTNGKTTTTRLLHHMIQTTGNDVALAGNNETPFSEVVLSEAPPPYVVLEVSSYQLETTQEFHPHYAAVLNLTPDHLGRHGDFAGYAAVKKRLFLEQRPEDYAVLNLDDPVVRDMASATRAQVGYFSLAQPAAGGLWLRGDEILDESTRIMAHVGDVPLPGRHNLANALAALCLVRASGLDWEKALAGLRNFGAVEHRIEPVVTINSVTFYNDSKSTNIDSLRVALESFETPVTLIAGGEGKGSDYGVLTSLVQAKVAHLVTLGTDAPKLEATFGKLISCERAGSMQEAIEKAYAFAVTKDKQQPAVVLLSPGCASFDMYLNFEARGEDFKARVRDLARTVENAGKEECKA